MSAIKSWTFAELKATDVLESAERWNKADFPVYRVDIVGHNDHSVMAEAYEDETLEIPIVYESPSYVEISDKSIELRKLGYVTSAIMSFDGP